MTLFRVLVTSVLFVFISATSALTQTDSPKIIVVSGPLLDPFFSALKKGADDAARDLRIDYQYSTVSGWDNIEAEFARLITQAGDLKPDALIVSNFFPNALNPILQKASNADIPLIIMDAGYAHWEQVGAFAYVGYDTNELGTRSGCLATTAPVSGYGCASAHAMGSVCGQTRALIFESENRKSLCLPFV